MSTELVKALREAAEKATNGVWETETGLPYARKPRVEGDGRLICEVGNVEVERQDQWEADATWISLASPDNITRLLDTLLATEQKMVAAEGNGRIRGLEEASHHLFKIASAFANTPTGDTMRSIVRDMAREIGSLSKAPTP